MICWYHWWINKLYQFTCGYQQTVSCWYQQVVSCWYQQVVSRWYQQIAGWWEPKLSKIPLGGPLRGPPWGVLDSFGFSSTSDLLISAWHDLLISTWHGLLISTGELIFRWWIHHRQIINSPVISTDHGMLISTDHVMLISTAWLNMTMQWTEQGRPLRGLMLENQYRQVKIVRINQISSD